MPVFDTRWAPDHIARLHGLDGRSPLLDQTATRGDDENLTDRMGVLHGAGAGLEHDDPAGHSATAPRPEQLLDFGVPAHPSLRQ
jgi:hypothetical protein